MPEALGTTRIRDVDRRRSRCVGLGDLDETRAVVGCHGDQGCQWFGTAVGYRTQSCDGVGTDIASVDRAGGAALPVVPLGFPASLLRQKDLHQSTARKPRLYFGVLVRTVYRLSRTLPERLSTPARGGGVDRPSSDCKMTGRLLVLSRKILSDLVQSPSPVRTPRSHMTAVRQLRVIVLTFLSHPTWTGGRLMSTVGRLARIVRPAIAQCWRHSRPRKC